MLVNLYLICTQYMNVHDVVAILMQVVAVGDGGYGGQLSARPCTMVRGWMKDAA